MIPHRKHQQEEGIDSWLMSYADMITLLMCFFIIFVSISEPKEERISALTDGMAGKFGTVDLSTPFQQTYIAVQAIIEEHHILKDFAITRSEKSIQMELSARTFFVPGSADLLPDKIPILVELVAALKKADFLDYRITIEGHTSDVPINTSIYPSNWELSAGRAARLVRLFIDEGIKPKYLKAVGLADTNPKVPNRDVNDDAIPENREKNERMVIRIERVS